MARPNPVTVMNDFDVPWVAPPKVKKVKITKPVRNSDEDEEEEEEELEEEEEDEEEDADNSERESGTDPEEASDQSPDLEKE
jgi:hypothetical protein